MSDSLSNHVKASVKSWTWVPGKAANPGYVHETSPNGVVRTVWDSDGCGDQGPGSAVDLLRQLRARHYDMASARFLSTDPIEFEDDTNQYRYVKNDPVNGIDPSGTRFLTPTCQLASDHSVAGCLLKDELKFLFPDIVKPDTPCIKTSPTRAVINTHEYGVMDLFDSLPPEIWGALQSTAPFSGYVGQDQKFRQDFRANLNGLMQGALKNERVLIGSFNPNVISWEDPAPIPETRTDRNIGRVADLADRGINFATWPAYLLGNRANTAPIIRAGVQTAAKAVDTISSAVEAVGGEISAFGNRVLENVDDFILVGLAAVLKKLNSAFNLNIDADRTIDELKMFIHGRVNIAQFSKAFVTAGDALVNFASGASKGIENFAKNSEKHFKRGVTDWLGLPKEIGDIDLANAKLVDFADILLKIVGYTWDDMLGLVSEAFQPLDLSLVLEVFETLSDSIGEEMPAKEGEEAEDRDPSLYAWVKNFIEDHKDVFTKGDIDSFVEGILKEIGEAAVVIVAEVVAKIVADIILAVLPTGVTQVIGIAKKIYQAVKFLIAYYERIKKLVETIQELFFAGFNGEGEEAIAKKTEDLFAASIVPILGGVAALFNLDGIPKRIRKALQGARNAAQAPAKALLKAAAKPLGPVVRNWKGGVESETGKTPLIPPSHFGPGNKKSVWIDDEGEIWVSASKGVKYDAYGKKDPVANMPTAKAKKDKLAPKAKTLASKAKAAATAKKGQKNRGQVKDAAKDVPDVAKAQAELAKELGDCSKGNCDPCQRTEEKTYTINGSGGTFKVKAQVATDSAGQVITLDSAGIRNGSSDPAVCRVISISGELKSPSVMTPRQGWPQSAMLDLLVRNNPDPEINSSTYNAGHLIGIQFGGPDSVLSLVPMYKFLNIRAWGSMESRIRKCLDTPGMGSALIEVKVTYGGSGNRKFIPTEFEVAIVFSNGGSIGGPMLRFVNRNDSRGFAQQPCLSQWSNPQPPSTPESR